MRISFTGTREGYNDWQANQLADWLTQRKNVIIIAAHGCCKGSDIQFHNLLRKICGKSVFISVFPSNNNYTRAPIPEDANWVDEQRPPLERDKLIVEAGYDQLLATPLQMVEVLRSGTWATIRYAKKKKVPCEIFWREKRAA
jgi:hypothetical protein